MKRIDSDNFDSEVRSIIENIIPGCSNIYIRVGYFFFSGFALIAKPIAAKNVKILVGIGTDKTVYDLVKNTEKHRRRSWYEAFIEKVDRENIFKKSDEQDAYFIFKEKLINGSLEIRWQNEKDHTKEFVFEFTKKHASEKKCAGNSLTGSSNLTYSGFITNAETNHLFDEKEEYSKAKSQFDRRWDPSSSIPLIDKVHVKEFLPYAEKIHFEQKPKPYLMFVRVLDEYFKDRSEETVKFPKTITKDFYDNYKYQKDAILKGIDIVKEHNGILLADVVGLGKSIIASSIAYNLKLRTIVICPPHLEDQWKRYLLAFKVDNIIYTSGSVHKALKESDSIPGEKLILVDEVHKFRNDETKDYLNLYQLCHGSSDGKTNKVLLLSATPFSNRPKDTFSLIKLFQIPTRTTLQKINNLTEYFEELTRRYNKLKEDQDQKKRNKNEISNDFNILGAQIRHMITPVMIRRSRLDLEKIKVYDDDLKKQGITFPDVEDPKSLEYDLDKLRDIYENTLGLINPKSKENKYKCSRYKPIAYVKPEFVEDILVRAGYEDNDAKRMPSAQQNIADFIKRLLVKRFESSSYSFFKTVNKMIKSSKMIIKYYEKGGFIPVYRKGEIPDVEELFESGTLEKDSDEIDIDDIENIGIEEIEKLPKVQELIAKGLWIIKKKELKPSYIEDVKKDLDVLESIKNDWEIINKKDFEDPKVSSFKEIISKQIKGDPIRKIVVFTEFSDTAQYLYDELKKDKYKVDIYTSKQATNKKYKNKIFENFDASIPIKDQKDDVNILIATDAISEGFNLHRAGTIFNFDIPYNPNRVVQRFGRINRINKQMFKNLKIFNFFPSEPGEGEIHMKRITSLKRMFFNAIFGDDTKVLSKYENLENYFEEEFRKLYKETESPETYFENIIYNLRDYKPETIDEAKGIARRVKSKRKIKNNDGFIAFSKKGEVPQFTFMNKKEEIKPIGDLQSLKTFDAKEDEKYLPFDKKFRLAYEKMESKIFEEKPIKPFSKKRRKLIEILELASFSSRYGDYYRMMHKVAKDLGQLTPFQEKLIKNKKKRLDKDIKEIQKFIPKKFLKNLIDRFDQVKLKNETLIITQQLND